jgi:hypothetical protein
VVVHTYNPRIWDEKLRQDGGLEAILGYVVISRAA